MRQCLHINTKHLTETLLDIVSLFATVDSKPTAVTAELILEGDHVLRTLLGDYLSFPVSLAGLVPPPLVDLLFAHIEVLRVLISKQLDALTSPHQIPSKLLP